MRKVAELGCIACKKLGYEGTPAELHHIPSGAMGSKWSYGEKVRQLALYSSLSTSS